MNCLLCWFNTAVTGLGRVNALHCGQGNGWNLIFTETPPSPPQADNVLANGSVATVEEGIWKFCHGEVNTLPFFLNIYHWIKKERGYNEWYHIRFGYSSGRDHLMSYFTAIRVVTIWFTDMDVSVCSHQRSLRLFGLPTKRMFLFMKGIIGAGI